MLVPFDFNWTRENAVTDDQFYELYSSCRTPRTFSPFLIAAIPAA